MGASLRRGVLALSAIFFSFTLQQLPAQTSNSGTITGSVTDSTGAVVRWSDGDHPQPGQWLHAHRNHLDGSKVAISFQNVPFNPLVI